MNPPLISEQEKDGLKEICNIGASKTASYLMENIKRKFDMNVADVTIINSESFIKYYRTISERYEDPITIRNNIKGVNGNIIIASSEKNMRTILNTNDKGKKLEEKIERCISEAVKRYLRGINDFISLGADLESTEVTYKFADPLAYKTIKKILRLGHNGETPKIMVNLTTLHMDEDKLLDMIMIVGIDDIDKILKSLRTLLN